MTGKAVRPLLALALPILLLIALALVTPTAFADTLVVTSAADSGTGSLRVAIAAASPGDTITFDPALAGATITLTSELDIGANLTISATVPITVSGNNSVRVFDVSGGQVTLTGLTIANGTYAGTDCGPFTDPCGAGVFVGPAATVTISNAVIVGNSTQYGGGIYIDRGEVIVANSVVSGNGAIIWGGGIYNYEGTLSLANTFVVANEAESGGGAFNDGGSTAIAGCSLAENNALSGGGIFNSGGALSVQASTIRGNSAEGLGGGIHNEFGTVSVVNSTLSGNEANTGGGIQNSDDSVSLSGSTVTGNRAVASGGGISSYGDNLTSTGLDNTIVSGNALDDTTPNDLALYFGATDSFSSGGYNLIGTFDPNITAFSQPGDQTGINDPQLGPLQDNGGSTLTHALLPGSPGIDAGDPSFAPPPATDQRGIPRVLDGLVDIGAVEKVKLTIVISAVVDSPSDGRLSWPDPGATCQADVYEGTAPYFNPTSVTYTDVSPPLLLVSRLGDPGTNYYYVARLTCAGDEALSNRVGEFDFDITPGS